VKLDAIIILHDGAIFKSRGNAVSPSITGISISSTIISGGVAVAISMAICPLAAEPEITSRESVNNALLTRPRITAESSTTKQLGISLKRHEGMHGYQ